MLRKNQRNYALQANQGKQLYELCDIENVCNLGYYDYT